MDFNHYFQNHEIDELLHQWAADYPNLLTLTRIGESYQNRPIWLLTITNQGNGPDRDKPAVWIDANIHSTEISGSTTALLIAHHLLISYGNDSQVKRLLDRGVYYIVPRLNPDGAALAMAEEPRFTRSGVRPYPWDEKDPGLHEKDMDGDRHIVQMRLVDPNGDWKVSSLDPRLMEKRQIHESGGAYYRLLPEGEIHQYDGHTIKLARPKAGLDFNRNFPFQWRPEAEQHGAGPYPASEAEIKAVLDFIVQHPNINLAITFHTFGRVILRPFSSKPDDEFEVNDLRVYKKLGELGTSSSGYPAVSTYHDFRYHPKETITGSFDDWLFDQLGVYSFTIELWDLPDEAGIKNRKFIEWFREHPHAEDFQILQWVDEHAQPGSFVGWHLYHHPQLGQVEIGGLDTMYTFRNPPPALIGAEAARQLPFALALGDLLPHLEIHTLQVTPLGDGEYAILLVVENSGFLPTYTSEQGRKRQAARPVRVELGIEPSMKLISGRQLIELGHLEGRNNKLDTTGFWEASPTDNRQRAEWVLQAPPGSSLNIHILSERAGSLHRTLLLE
jgi:murein tripeptide amidase MpaA